MNRHTICIVRILNLWNLICRRRYISSRKQWELCSFAPSALTWKNIFILEDWLARRTEYCWIKLAYTAAGCGEEPICCSVFLLKNLYLQHRIIITHFDPCHRPDGSTRGQWRIFICILFLTAAGILYFFRDIRLSLTLLAIAIILQTCFRAVRSRLARRRQRRVLP